MQYYAYELAHSLVSPARFAARATRNFLDLTVPPAVRGLGLKTYLAGLEVFEDMTRRYGKPEFGISSTNIHGLTVPIREEIVMQKTFCDLLHFDRDENVAGKRYDPEHGVVRKSWLFVMVLGFSRRAYCELVFDQRIETWLWLHVEAFKYFGGVPRVTFNRPAAAGDGDLPVHYRIYRSTLNPVPLYHSNMAMEWWDLGSPRSSFSFDDVNATAGTYRYSIVAYDNWNNEAGTTVGPVTVTTGGIYIMETRPGMQNVADYSEPAGSFSDSSAHSTAPGCTTTPPNLFS